MPTISRRNILFGTATIAAAAVAAPAIAQTTLRKRRVLVLGAGVAGLTAALALHRKGHKVTVIEYQERIGGRLWSIPLAGGQFSEAGGGHFRSNMPYVMSYIRKFKLPLISLNDGLPKYFLDGKSAYAWNPGDRPWPLSQEERNVTIASSLVRYLSRSGLDTDTILGARWPDQATADALDDVTIGDLLRNSGASEAFCKLFSAHEGPFILDAVALAVMPALAYHLGSPALYRIAGGNSRLPLAMANAIGSENISLGEQVSEIDESGQDVRVVTKSGKVFSGDAVISTIPFSVIGDVKVTPGWSAAKRRMFQQMGWGNTVKIIVQTQKPKWLNAGAYGWPMAGGDRPWERVIDITGNEVGGYGNIFFYLNGPNANAVLAEPEAVRGDAIISHFQDDMPGVVSDIIMKKSFAWSEQPWIKGSFGFMRPGGAWMIKEWAKPEGRIHLAGDFTTLKSGWVEGAIESGLRAARQIDPEAPVEGNPEIRPEQKL